MTEIGITNRERIALLEACLKKAQHEESTLEQVMNAASDKATEYHDSEQKTWYLEYVDELEGQHDELEKQVTMIEDWLIELNAPGWVST